MSLSENDRKFHIKRFLPDLVTILIVVLMVLCSELLGEKEIIFPEITALAVGYLVAPKRSWMVNGKRMIFLIGICAVLGVLMVRCVPLPTVWEVIIAFAFAQALFMVSGTTFAPFVSAIVLPVMLRTTTFIYPIAAVVLTTIIVLFHNLFRRFGMIEDDSYIPETLKSKWDIFDTALRVAITAVLVWLAFHFGVKYIMAPPLLVAFTEFSRPKNKTRNKPVRAVIVMTGCAAAGALFRYLLNMKLHLSLTVAAAVAAIVVLVLVHLLKMYMPPAGALAILAMIIPEEAVLWFPLEILAGSVLILLLSRLLFSGRQDRAVEEYELRAGERADAAETSGADATTGADATAGADETAGADANSDAK